MKTLRFDIDIAAPRARVWALLQAPDSYRDWTAAFCQGSTFEGSWAQGSEMRFLSPSGDGMLAQMAENRRHELLSIRHIGAIEKGVPDTTSEAVRAWAPAYENYRFADAPGGCRLSVEVDTLPAYESYMEQTFPLALQRLKALCESPGDGADSSPETRCLARMFEAINRNDMDDMARDFDADIVRVEPEGFPTAGTYRGIDAVRAHVAHGRGTWAEGECRTERFVQNGARCVVFLHALVRLRESDQWVDGRFADGFEFRQGKIVHYQSFTYRAQALRWAGLAETESA